MQDSKKALLSSFAFLLVVVLLSVIIIEPYLQSEALYWEDAKVRDNLEGELDCLIVGASHCVHAFIPSIIDENTGFHTYNLGGSLMTFPGRKALLEKELKRNPISTVVIELSFNSLLRDEKDEYGEGDTYVISRLGSLSERVRYFFRSTQFLDYEDVYSLSLFLGMVFWGRLLSGRGINNVVAQNRGYSPSEASDISMPITEYLKIYNTMSLNAEYRSENIQQLAELVSLCKQYDVNVIIAVVPVSNQFVWRGEHWERFTSTLTSFCSEHNCKLFDFNLYYNRYEVFSDTYSFSDDIHLSSNGAETFSYLFSDVLLKEMKGEDTSRLFVGSYEELKHLDPAYQELEAH